MENSENSCSAKMLQHATKICIHILRWGIFFNWTLETASGNDMDNIKCSHGYTQHSTAQDTTQQGSAEQSCSGQLATLFGVRPFSRLQRVQCKYKSTKCTTNTSRMACQTRQGSHRCINCLIVCRDRDVIMSIKLFAGAVTRQATGHGPSLDLWLLSGLVCLTGVVCAGWAPVG